MDSRIQQVKIDTAAIRQQLVDHPLYAQIDTLEKLRVFMEHHVFAVWDFMSLLKTLQMQLTCVQVPWVPVGNATTRYLINEIVCGEESDVDEDGNRCSHFELYLKAMNDAGANTAPVLSLLEAVKSGIPIFEAIEQSAAPAAAKQFMQHTFAVINEGKLANQVGVFTFGREDLIPSMFLSFVTELNRTHHNTLNTLKYYLERHIEVDGDHHSVLAYEMTSLLCGNDETKWTEMTAAINRSLHSRLALWNGIVEAISK